MGTYLRFIAMHDELHQILNLSVTFKWNYIKSNKSCTLTLKPRKLREMLLTKRSVPTCLNTITIITHNYCVFQPKDVKVASPSTVLKRIQLQQQ